MDLLEVRNESRIVVDLGDADGVVGDLEVGGGWVRVIVNGRECAMRKEGLRGYWVLKGSKPVIRTLTSSEDRYLTLRSRKSHCEGRESRGL